MACVLSGAARPDEHRRRGNKSAMRGFLSSAIGAVAEEFGIDTFRAVDGKRKAQAATLGARQRQRIKCLLIRALTSKAAWLTSRRRRLFLLRNENATCPAISRNLKRPKEEKAASSRSLTACLLITASLREPCRHRRGGDARQATGGKRPQRCQIGREELRSTCVVKPAIAPKL